MKAFICQFNLTGHGICWKTRLSMFYLKNKALFMRSGLAVERSSRTFSKRFSRKDLYRLWSGANDSQHPRWKPVTHTSVFVPTLDSTYWDSCPTWLFSTTACDAEEAVGPLISEHVRATSQALAARWRTGEARLDPDAWMNWVTTCYKSCVSSHHQSVICCTCFRRAGRQGNPPRRWVCV